MLIDPSLLLSLIVVALSAGVMALFALQRTLQQGFNQLIRGLEELVRAQRHRRDDDH